MKKSLIFSIIAIVLLLIKSGWFLCGIDALLLDFSPCSIRLWSTYACFCCLVIAPIFVFKNIRWTYIANLGLDIWLVGNLIYYRCFGDLLSHWLWANISAMNGVWGSVIVFFRWGDCVFLVLSVLWILFCELYIIKHVNLPNFKTALLSFCAGVVLFVPVGYTNHKLDYAISPFSQYYRDISMGRQWYVTTYGPIAQLVHEIVDACYPEPEYVSPSADEMRPYWDQAVPDSDTCNLLIIFVESLESWVLDKQGDCPHIMPHVAAFEKHPFSHTFMVFPNVAEGKSSDAQLIVLTGLLPIKNGAVSMRYMQNTFPSLIHYSHAVTKQMFIPTSVGSWNQAAMSKAYGFDALWGEEVSDRVVVDSVISAIKQADQPFLIFHTTMASHAPFLTFADSSSLPNCDGYDMNRYNYIRSLNYTDQQLGREIDAIMQDSILSKNTRILLIGDHTIFPESAFVPMIWYDPTCRELNYPNPMPQVDVYRFLRHEAHISTPWLGLNESDLELSNRLIATDAFQNK